MKFLPKLPFSESRSGNLSYLPQYKPYPYRRFFRFKGKPVPYFKAGLCLALASGILGLCARRIPGFAQGYSTTVYPVLAGIIGRFCGLFPFSFSEAGLYGSCLAFLYLIIRYIRRPLHFFSRAFFFCSALLFLYTINCGVNYYRNPFSYEADISIKESSPEELYRLCLYLTEQVNRSLLEADASQDGWPDTGQSENSPLLSHAALRSMGLEGKEAMKALGDIYPQLHGSYPYPKPLMNSRLLSVQQLCGIYSPFTIEANYNREMPYYNIPHTICHELSHLKGFMREDEANFIGYLACVDSTSAYFQYSGYLTGWVYAGNALAQVDLEGYSRLYNQLPPPGLRRFGLEQPFLGPL